MRITTNALSGTPHVAPTSETPRVEGPPESSEATPVAAPNTPLQSAAMKPALKAMAEMPEIDQAKVDALRDALSKGEIKFDANKLAGLIARYHGGQG